MGFQAGNTLGLDEVRENPYITGSEVAMATTVQIEEISTITAKGQTTVPKAVRQALGVTYGGQIAFRIENGRVSVVNPEVEHRDPALASFLKVLEKDIAGGRNVRDLPASLSATLRRAAKSKIDLTESLEGDVEM
jgi:antitoxin PrlF